ncbi:hypothetical protein [Endozoicomonas sp. Mp262]|uniref:hypothetical protein n=1 Tax=Endozoicomonas sp. Mp262 TaxID=2919499 RepID=UPI0021D9BDA4
MKKTIMMAAALATALSTSSAFAWWGDNDNNDGKSGGGCYGGHQMHQGQKGHHGRHGTRGPGMKEQMNRSYTADETRTLAEARLLRKGNPNLKVGEVIPTDNGYKLTIVTKDNSLVKERELAKNGMPLERYNAIKKRMDAWESRQNG